MKLFALLYLLFINILTFIVFGLDKHRAAAGKWRIRERTLLLLAAAGGALGALAGMELLRHKTRHTRFRYGVPAILLAQVSLLVLAAIFCGGSV